MNPSSTRKSITILQVSEVCTASENSESEEEKPTEPFKTMAFQLEDLKIGTFVVVPFQIGKKKSKHFLAVIQWEILPDRELKVMFFWKFHGSIHFSSKWKWHVFNKLRPNCTSCAFPTNYNQREEVFLYIPTKYLCNSVGQVKWLPVRRKMRQSRTWNTDPVYLLIVWMHLISLTS